MKVADDQMQNFNVVKELVKLEINSASVDFSILQPYEVELKYINPLNNELDVFSIILKRIGEKYADKLTDYNKYILAYYQRILQIATEKCANCKSALQEGNSAKAEDEYKSIFAIIFIELVELIHICIKNYSQDDMEVHAKYFLSIINEAAKEDFDISKSYNNIIDNVDYIKDVLIQHFVSINKPVEESHEGSK
jgi:hypothetical protein